MSANLPAPLAQTAFDAAEEFARQSLSPATLAAYRTDWVTFVDWCRSVDLSPQSAEPATVAAYLATMAQTHARSTVERRLVSIGQAHKLSGFDWWPSAPGDPQHAPRHVPPSRQAAPEGGRAWPVGSRRAARCLRGEHRRESRSRAVPCSLRWRAPPIRARRQVPGGRCVPA
ncbi:hypothetical protein ABIE45_006350 [Methylobacterium sp. OAE515]|uniref:hypothetical protein n=1 Tax=Methylobacterium sp. OAE515 TaxID=2817895 RepID=UPI001A0DEFF2